MFATIKDLDLIILTKNDYLEAEIFSDYEYPFYEVAIMDRKDVETDGPCLFKYHTGSNSDLFEITNKRIIFKLNTADLEMPVADYHCIVTGIDDDGHREEVQRFVIAVRHMC